MKEKWDSLNDHLSDTQRKVEVCLLQLSSLDDHIEQFQRKLTDIEAKVKAEQELKATLPEKKMQLQNHKVCVIII